MASTKERTFFLLLLLAASAVLAFLVFQPFITTVALAGICAVLLSPLHDRVKEQIPNLPGFSALVTLIIGALVIIIPLAIVGTIVVSEARGAYASLASGSTSLTVQEATLRIGDWLEPYFPGAATLSQSIAGEINTYIAQALDWMVRHAGDAFTKIVSGFLHFLIFFMTLYYFLKDGAGLKDLLTKKSPIEEGEVRTIFEHLSKTVTGIIRGSLIIALVQGTLAGLGYWLFGIPNPSLWAVTTAISSLIPGAGTSLILFPAVLFLFATGNVGGAIGLALWAMLMVGSIDNFLSPKLMSRGAGLHPLLILLSVIGGLAFYGPVGIFMGPLTVSLLFALYLTYSHSKPDWL